MTIASSLFRRRRVLVIGGATALLHLLLLGWAGDQLGAVPTPLPSPQPQTIVAQLHAAMAAPQAVAEVVQKPTPAPRPKPRAAKPAPQPVPPPDVADAAPAVAPADAAPADTAAMQASADVAPVATDTSAAAASNASASSSATQAVAASATPPAPSAPPAAANAASAPLVAYKASIPPSAVVALDVVRTDDDGKLWHGEATMSWKVRDNAYNLTMDVGIRVLFARVSLAVLTSEGRIDASGFVPTTMTEKRRSRALTATHFNRGSHQITFSASQAVYEIEDGAQDKATFALQLASIARADPTQVAHAVTLQVGEDKDALIYRFDVLGEEDVDTKLGRLHTLHLSRAPVAGRYSSRLDVWLAPAHGWYPVQIRNTEASGAVTTQTVSKIELTESGS